MDTTAHYMLSASALHDLAPGILGVVHGPDGEHEGAPVWGGPVYYHDSKGQYRMAHVAHVGTGRDDDAVMLLDATEIRRCAMRRYATLPDVFWYDLRVESVRAWFMRLCMEALGIVSDAATLIETGTPEHGFIFLRGFNAIRQDISWSWNRSTGNPISAGQIHLPPACDRASALRALVLALAPKIAALGGA